MFSNIERFNADLERLIAEAKTLELSLMVRVYGEKVVAEALKQKWDAAKKQLEEASSFNVAYEAWYSEALVLIKQVLPDRFQDFKEHFESPKNRKEITFSSYRIQDALKGVQVTRPGGETIVDSSASIPHFQQQYAIVLAAQRRFSSSLFDIRHLVQADLCDGELGAARELLKNKFIRAAGAIAGVVLEKHLKRVCDDHAVKVQKKHPSISDLNELLKSAGVIEITQWRYITLLADYRNLCDHNKHIEPTDAQVGDLIEGVDKVVKTVI